MRLLIVPRLAIFSIPWVSVCREINGAQCTSVLRPCQGDIVLQGLTVVVDTSGKTHGWRWAFSTIQFLHRRRFTVIHHSWPLPARCFGISPFFLSARQRPDHLQAVLDHSGYVHSRALILHSPSSTSLQASSLTQCSNVVTRLLAGLVWYRGTIFWLFGGNNILLRRMYDRLVHVIRDINQTVLR